MWVYYDDDLQKWKPYWVPNVRYSLVVVRNGRSALGRTFEHAHYGFARRNELGPFFLNLFMVVRVAMGEIKGGGVVVFAEQRISDPLRDLGRKYRVTHLVDSNLLLTSKTKVPYWPGLP